MANKRRRRTPNPRRKCIFCGNGPTSGEHLWPRWMHSYLPKREDPGRDERYYNLRNAHIVTRAELKRRPGHVYTTQIRAVWKHKGMMMALYTFASALEAVVLNRKLHAQQARRLRSLAADITTPATRIVTIPLLQDSVIQLSQ